MAAKLPQMSADFARWYSETFMEDGAVRNARWKSVVEIALKATYLTIEVLVRLAFATKAPASGHKNDELEAAYSAVVTAINASDRSFDPARSTRELQVLSAAILVRLFATSPDAALAVSTASFGRSRTPDLPMDLAGLAEEALVALSGQQHVRTDPKTLHVTVPNINFEVDEATVQDNSPTQWKNELETLRDAADEAFQTVVEGQNRAINALIRRIVLGDEDLQMLWWQTGGRSRQLGIPFAKIDAALQPFILGRELGSMTTVSPGPVSVRAMLAKAGIGTGKLKVQEAVNAVTPDWAAAASTRKTVSPATTPLHFALEKRAELGSTDAWQAGWAALTGFPADIALPAVQLAELFYREHLFLHVNA